MSLKADVMAGRGRCAPQRGRLGAAELRFLKRILQD